MEVSKFINSASTAPKTTPSAWGRLTPSTIGSFGSRTGATTPVTLTTTATTADDSLSSAHVSYTPFHPTSRAGSAATAHLLEGCSDDSDKLGGCFNIVADTLCGEECGTLSSDASLSEFRQQQQQQPPLQSPFWNNHHLQRPRKAGKTTPVRHNHHTSNTNNTSPASSSAHNRALYGSKRRRKEKGYSPQKPQQNQNQSKRGGIMLCGSSLLDDCHSSDFHRYNCSFTNCNTTKGSFDDHDTIDTECQSHLDGSVIIQHQFDALTLSARAKEIQQQQQQQQQNLLAVGSTFNTDCDLSYSDSEWEADNTILDQTNPTNHNASVADTSVPTPPKLWNVASSSPHYLDQYLNHDDNKMVPANDIAPVPELFSPAPLPETPLPPPPPIDMTWNLSRVSSQSPTSTHDDFSVTSFDENSSLSKDDNDHEKQSHDSGVMWRHQHQQKHPHQLNNHHDKSNCITYHNNNATQLKTKSRRDERSTQHPKSPRKHRRHTKGQPPCTTIRYVTPLSPYSSDQSSLSSVAAFEDDDDMDIRGKHTSDTWSHAAAQPLKDDSHNNDTTMESSILMDLTKDLTDIAIYAGKSSETLVQHLFQHMCEDTSTTLSSSPPTAPTKPKSPSRTADK